MSEAENGKNNNAIQFLWVGLISLIISLVIIMACRHYKNVNKERIFCIGFHRTGTRSLHTYLQNLGYKSIHWPEKFQDLVKKHVDNPKKVIKILGPIFYQHDCFSDVPFPGLYKELDEKFPNSKFILTYRDPEKWWQSVCKHWRLHNVQSRELDSFEYIQYRLYEPHEKRDYSIKDKDVLINKFNKHFDEVIEYFKSRKGDLLILSLEDSSLNVKVSNFLHRKVINQYPLITG
jgi:hypothetical protein